MTDRPLEWEKRIADEEHLIALEILRRARAAELDARKKLQKVSEEYYRANPDLPKPENARG